MHAQMCTDEGVSPSEDKRTANIQKSLLSTVESGDKTQAVITFRH